TASAAAASSMLPRRDLLAHLRGTALSRSRDAGSKRGYASSFYHDRSTYRNGSKRRQLIHLASDGREPARGCDLLNHQNASMPVAPAARMISAARFGCVGSCGLSKMAIRFACGITLFEQLDMLTSHVTLLHRKPSDVAAGPRKTGRHHCIDRVG